MITPGAQAVHDLGLFELEGNTVNGAAAGDDWANLYNGGGSPASTLPTCTKLANTNCFETFALDADKIGKAGDNSYFTGGGSKDRNDIAQWNWGQNDQSPDKNDITNALAAAYHKGDGKLVLYFAADRHAVNGDAQMAFWFNQKPMCLADNDPATPAGVGANCPASTPNQVANTGKFVDPTTGDLAHHTDGDILVVVNYNNGGTIGLAGVFTWQGGIGGAPVQSLFGDNADCKTIGPADSFCSTSNVAPLAGEPPWAYDGKGGNAPPTNDSYDTSAFLEGGIDLESIQGAGTCFPSFLAETRSSSGPNSGLSLDATLKDFALHSFQLCDSTLVTTPKQGDGSDITGPLSIGTGIVSVKDSADLTVNGITTWSGTLDFYLCGPIAAPATCDGTTNVGTKIGATANINQGTAMPFLSDAATVSSVGRYCWRGVFTSATQGVPSRTDSSTGECFTVSPVQPPLDTAAVDPEVNFGDPVEDNATLSGTATQPGSPIIQGPAGPAAGGKIIFTLLKADCTTLATGTGTNPQEVAVSGDGTYGPVSFTPDAPGTYHWKAEYVPAAGDPNNLGSTHNGSCTDTDETVVVQKVPTSITTAQSVFPNDSATVSVSAGSTGNVQGSVKFRLFDTLANCSSLTASDTVGVGGLLYRQIVALPGNQTSSTVGTSNTSVAVSTDTTVYWRVEFTSTNPAQFGRNSICQESTQTVFVNDSSGGTEP